LPSASPATPLTFVWVMVVPWYSSVPPVPLAGSAIWTYILPSTIVVLVPSAAFARSMVMGTGAPSATPGAATVIVIGSVTGVTPVGSMSFKSAWP